MSNITILGCNSFRSKKDEGKIYYIVYWAEDLYGSAAKGKGAYTSFVNEGTYFDCAKEVGNEVEAITLHAGNNHTFSLL